MSVYDGARLMVWRGHPVTYYGCDDCGCVYFDKKEPTLRPNNKFCDRACMACVLDLRLPPYDMQKRPRGHRELIEKIAKELED
jgi:hypothetical protein